MLPYDTNFRFCIDDHLLDQTWQVVELGIYKTVVLPWADVGLRVSGDLMTPLTSSPVGRFSHH